MEAIIPIEIGMPTLRIEIPEEANTEALTKDLDMTDELREATTVSMALYQQRITNLYNRRVTQHEFGAEDLLLRRVFENTADPASDKFQPKWKGPYMIVRVGSVGSYTLDKSDGIPVPRMWNAMHLKMSYQ